MAAAAISVVGLCKDYGTLRAVDGLSFTVARGEIVALLGPNGASASVVTLRRFRWEPNPAAAGSSRRRRLRRSAQVAPTGE